MDKKNFRTETAFQITMRLIRDMQEKKLITEAEYRDAERLMLDKYKPFFASLYT